MSVDARSRIPSLDGIRGAAVLLVTMFHFLAIPDPNRGIRALSFKVAYAGWIGVDLFFVLSGFLITTILWNSKEAPHYFRNFYMRRVLRIFPLYYGVLVAVLLVVPMIDHLRTPLVQDVLRRQWMFWAYVSNFSTRKLDGDWLNLGHFWSLAIEEQFYLMWPAIVFFSSRARAVRIVVGAVLFSLLARVGFLLVAMHAPNLAKIAGPAAFSWTPCRLDALAIGALIALLGMDVRWRRMMEIGARSLGVLTALVTAWLIWSNRINDVFSIPRSTLGAIFSSLKYLIVALTFGSILVEATRALSPVGQLFGVRPLRFLGKYSYGIYVFQGVLAPAIALLLPGLALRARASDMAAYTYFAISMFIVLLVSFISWHAYEQWFLRWKRLFPRAAAASSQARAILSTNE